MSESKLSNLEQQTVALAGVAQAARMVDQISKTGSYPLAHSRRTASRIYSVACPGSSWGCII
jgi:high frequency lysogenization protein